jgi:hypothetical protein
MKRRKLTINRMKLVCVTVFIRIDGEAMTMRDAIATEMWNNYLLCLQERGLSVQQEELL